MKIRILYFSIKSNTRWFVNTADSQTSTLSISSNRLNDREKQLRNFKRFMRATNGPTIRLDDVYQPFYKMRNINVDECVTPWITTEQCGYKYNRKTDDFECIG